MTRKRVLVVGGTGMLGHKLVQVLSGDAAFEVHATVRRLPTAAFTFPAVYHTGIELGEGSEPLGRLLAEVATDVVLNAVGAIKQKDLASTVDETYYLNGTLPHLLALLNPNPEGKVVHFSTDCVFRGDRGGYRQDEPADAVDLYGRSKAVGELTYGRNLTLRTSIVGWETGGHLGLLSWFLSQPKGSTLRGYSEAIYSGLPTVTLARTVRRLLTDMPSLTGLWHVASQPISKLALLARISGALDLGHTLVPDPAMRIDRSLEDAPFRAATATTTPGWPQLVAELADDFRSLPYEDVYAALAGS